MQNEILEVVTKFNENLLASAKAFGELNMRAFEQVSAKQAAIMSECMESSAKQYEVLTTAKDYKDAVAAQSELMKGCSEKFLANVRETSEMMTSVHDEMSGLIEEAAKFTSESVEQAGKAAQKVA